MITLPRCLRVAGVVMILVSLGVAGDMPGIPPKPDRVPAAPPCDDRPGQQPDGLETHRPYLRGKVPVVLIHGLWGQPQLWGRMVEGIEADPALRRQYQFWTFRYASGDSIPYSAHLLRQSLRRARRAFDPDGTDAAFDRMVVIGHSLGGILAKMMVQDSGSRLWQTVSARPVDQVGGPPEDRRLLQEAFCYSPVPEVRGSSSSRRRIAEALSRSAPSEGSVRGFAAGRAASSGPSGPCWRTMIRICSRPRSWRNSRRAPASGLGEPSPDGPLRPADRTVGPLSFDHSGRP